MENGETKLVNAYVVKLCREVGAIGAIQNSRDETRRSGFTVPELSLIFLSWFMVNRWSVVLVDDNAAVDVSTRTTIIYL